MLKRIKHIVVLVWRMQAKKFLLWCFKQSIKRRYNAKYYRGETWKYKLALNEAAMLVHRLTETCPVRYDSKDVDFIAAGDACSKCRLTDCKQPELCWFNYFKCCGYYDKIDEECDKRDKLEDLEVEDGS